MDGGAPATGPKEVPLRRHLAPARLRRGVPGRGGRHLRGPGRLGVPHAEPLKAPFGVALGGHQEPGHVAPRVIFDQTNYIRICYLK